MAAAPTVLVTGFEPFDGDEENPSALVARALDGRRIAGAAIRCRLLPVSLDGLDAALDAALGDLSAGPRAVIALGLAGGEAVIRLERVALNVADFRIPDNAGALARNLPLEPGGPDARLSRLPLEAILAACRPGCPAASSTCRPCPARWRGGSRGPGPGLRPRPRPRLHAPRPPGPGHRGRRGGHPGRGRA
ncbi:MAG: hypothetical protein ACKOGH_08050 [Alphaproteobacteria bacterium]